jgi:hypothetical protein
MLIREVTDHLRMREIIMANCALLVGINTYPGQPLNATPVLSIALYSLWRNSLLFLAGISKAAR